MYPATRSPGRIPSVGRRAVVPPERPLLVAHLPPATFSAEDDGRPTVTPAQHVLREVQGRVWKESRAGHLPDVVNDARAHLAAYPAERPDFTPEVGGVIDGEAIEIVVSRKRLP
jgi:hypothetical protein